MVNIAGLTVDVEMQFACPCLLFCCDVIVSLGKYIKACLVEEIVACLVLLPSVDGALPFAAHPVN